MDDKKVVIFKVNNLEYGLPGQYVQSIEKMQPITRVPFTPSYIKGVFNLRGVVIPVLDLSDALETKSSEESGEKKIIIVHFEETEIGLIIDEANDVLTVSEEQLEPMSEKLKLSHLFSGILKLENRLISILNIESVLYPKRKEV